MYKRNFLNLLNNHTLKIENFKTINKNIHQKSLQILQKNYIKTLIHISYSDLNYFLKIVTRERNGVKRDKNAIREN